MAKSERVMEERRETEMRRQIFCALTEFRGDDGGRLLNDIDDFHKLADGLFQALKAKGLLKMTVEDED
jgi:hypothetical protein